MSNKFPKLALPPESMDWGREVEKRLGMQEKSISRASEAAFRAEGAQNGLVDLVAKEATTGNIAATVEPLAPAAVTGTPTGTWGVDGSADSKVALSWDMVAADTRGEYCPVSQYEVWSRSNATAPVRVLASTTNTAVVEGLPVGTTYLFSVRAQSAGSGTWGQFSPEVSVETVAPNVPLAAPTTPSASSALGAISVSWDGKLISGPAPAQLNHVYVGASATQGGTYTPIGQPLMGAGTAAVTDVPVGQTRWFKLFAVDNAGKVSAGSAAVSATSEGVDVSGIEADLTALQGSITQLGTDLGATDAKAVAAQSAANSAASAASAAQGTANSAASAASAAQTTANGKSKVTYSTAIPGTTAGSAGDIWFRTAAGGVIIAQYENTGGTNWDVRTLDNAVIANLDAGKLTAGTISADRIGATSITAAKLAADAVTADKIEANAVTAVKILAGAVTTDKMTANTINGDRITANTLHADKIVANTITAGKIATNAITADKILAGAVETNKIKAGALDAFLIVGGNIQTNAAANRGVNINAAGLTAYDTSGNVTVAISSSGAASFKGDLETGSGNAIFKATTQGIQLGSGTFASAPFSVTAAGAMKATNASITGTINATGGAITGNLTLTGKLSATYDTPTSTYVGTTKLDGTEFYTESVMKHNGYVRGVGVGSGGVDFTGYDPGAGVTDGLNSFNLEMEGSGLTLSKTVGPVNGSYPVAFTRFHDPVNGVADGIATGGISAREVNIRDGQWVPINLASGIYAFPSDIPRARKSILTGEIEVRGKIRGTGTAGYSIGTLPVGLRPTDTTQIWSTLGFYVQVTEDGNVASTQNGIREQVFHGFLCPTVW